MKNIFKCPVNLNLRKEPSKCHTNFVLNFSFLDFFLAPKFFSRLFSRLFFQFFSRLFSPLFPPLFSRLFPPILDFFPDYSPRLWSKPANIYMQTKWLQEFFVNMCSRKNSELKSRKKSGKKSWKKLRKKSRKKLRKKSGKKSTKKSTKKLRSLKPATQALKMRTLFK